MKYSMIIAYAICTYILLCIPDVAFSQCSTDCDIQCVGQLNLSLDETCMTEITPQMGGIGVTAGDPCYTVEVFDEHNNLVPNNIVDFNFLDETLTYRVTEEECGNACWGELTVEYKLPPQITCPPDLTVFCNAVDFLEVPPATGACAAFNVQLISEQSTPMPCSDIYNGAVVRTYQAIDEFGNTDTCSHRVLLQRLPLDDIIFPGPATISCSDTLLTFNDDGVPFPFFTQPLTGSGTGVGVPVLCLPDFPSGLSCPLTGSGSGIPLVPQGGALIIIETGDPDMPFDTEFIPQSSINSLCNAAVIFNDIEFPSDGCSRKILRTFEVFEWWCNTEIQRTGSQVIEIIDDIAPMITCPPDQIVSTSSNCGAQVLLPPSNPTDECGNDISVRINFPGGAINTDGGIVDLNRGLNIISYTANDGCGNMATCQTTFTVKDLNQPVAICERDKVIALTTSNTTRAPAEVFDNGSFDDCGIDRLEVFRPDNPCESSISFGSEVNIRNTYQSSASSSNGGTGSVEIPIEDWLGVTPNTFVLNGIVVPGIEFEQYRGLYNIDVSDNDISFVSVVDPDNPPYPGFIRTIEPGTFDRYYFDFAQPHGITTASADDDNIDVIILSDSEILVEVGPGYYTGNSGFTIDLSRFNNYVDFCCVDANQFVDVMLRVTDKEGNFSQCWVSVEVQDKTIPDLTCPADVVIDCTVPYSLANLSASFGDASVAGNCAATQLPVVNVDDNVSQCGVGSIERTFSLRDVNDNILRTCKQTITITNNAPFVLTDVELPLDFEVSDRCTAQDLHPDFLPFENAYPRYTIGEGQCAMLGFDFTDEVFSADPLSGECAVIRRTWRVIDWCNSVGGSISSFEFGRPQIIKVFNNTPPVLNASSDILIETQGGNCESGQILVERNATDDCSTILAYNYVVRNNANGMVVATGDTNRVTGRFPVGTYTIEWVVSDLCGNSDTDLQQLQIISTKAPTPICHNGLSVSLVGHDSNGDGQIDTEQVEIWAEDFNAGSYPGCNNEIAFSFSADTTDRFVIYDCSDIGRQTIQLWVTDVITGAQDFCLAFVDIQDAGSCPDALRVAVGGQVSTEEAIEIVGVEVELDGAARTDVTDDLGLYAFEDMPLGGSYVVRPEMDNNHAEGVNTIDLIRLQRHILGIERLDSPYKLIAADINDSGNVDGVDLVELRKFILGLYTEFPQNTSWRFVSQDYVFPDATNPWLTQFDEAYMIPSLSENMILDFIGVKIGDLDNTALNARNNSGSSKVSITLENQPMHTGEIGEIVVSSLNDIIGLQGTLEFDTDRFEILSVVSHSGEDSSEQFYLDRQEEGWMTMSHVVNDRQDGNPELFTIEILAKDNISANENLLTLTSNVTEVESYDSEMKIHPLTIREANNGKANILSVTPNPWVDKAAVNFIIEKDSEVRFEFFDINGRLLYANNNHYTSGRHSLKITRDDLGTSGFVFIRMTVGSSSSKHKMILY